MFPAHAFCGLPVLRRATACLAGQKPGASEGEGLAFLVSSFLLPLVLGFASTRARAAETSGPLRAGAATSNITPWLGISMNGGHHDRKATHVHDELHARALVLDDGKTRVAIVACDSCVIQREIFDSAKRVAEARTGIPAGHMLMSATHTHSGPTATAVFGSEPEPAYQEFLARRIADAVACAANNLAPARIGWGSGAKPEQVFNRRWHMKPEGLVPDPFGGTTDKVRMNPPRGHAALIEPAGPTDPQIGILSVQSSAGRPVSVLANYGLHYVGGTGPGHISADYFGVFADLIQARLNADRLDPPFVAMLTNGASGDVNNINFRAQDAPGPFQAYRQMRAVAEDVAAEADRVIGGMQYRDGVRLGVREARITLGVRRPNAEEVEQARAMLAQIKPGAAPTLPQVYANETVKMAEYPPSVEVPLQVLRIGEAAVVALPCEVFAEVGLEIKAKSPFKPTLVIALANGYFGYLPTPRQHQLGGYETWRARSSFLEVDASTKIVDRVVSMLQ